LVSGTGRRADLPGWLAAGKTGTSQDFRDAWFIGYTSRLVTGVWLGNDDNTPTRKAVGGGLPVEIWSRFMKVAHVGVPPSTLPGLSDAGWFNQAPAAQPLPPRGIDETGAGAAADHGGQRNKGGGDGLDFWLLDKLFGRH
jgi:penicillin-binding protein 1A